MTEARAGGEHLRPAQNRTYGMKHAERKWSLLQGSWQPSGDCRQESSASLGQDHRVIEYWSEEGLQRFIESSHLVSLMKGLRFEVKWLTQEVKWLLPAISTGYKARQDLSQMLFLQTIFFPTIIQYLPPAAKALSYQILKWGKNMSWPNCLNNCNSSYPGTVIYDIWQSLE